MRIETTRRKGEKDRERERRVEERGSCEGKPVRLPALAIRRSIHFHRSANGAARMGGNERGAERGW